MRIHKTKVLDLSREPCIQGIARRIWQYLYDTYAVGGDTRQLDNMLADYDWLCCHLKEQRDLHFLWYFEGFFTNLEPKESFLECKRDAQHANHSLLIVTWEADTATAEIFFVRPDADRN